jgi:hypothetical protein
LMAVLAVKVYVENNQQEQRDQLEAQKIEGIALRIIEVMDKPTTFDDIYNKLNFPIYADADRAFDRLYDTKRSDYDPVKLVDPKDGREHTVRLFYKRPKPGN